MASFTFTREIGAPPETVFEVLTDHRRYSELTPLRKSELEREGEGDVNGVGAIRRLTAVGPPMREEVIAFEAPSRFSYTVLSGLPGVWTSFLLAFAAGGILAMLSDTMFPEAFKNGGPWVALATTAGFAVAILMGQLN